MNTTFDVLTELEKRMQGDKQTVEATFGYSRGHARCLMLLREFRREIEGEEDEHH